MGFSSEDAAVSEPMVIQTPARPGGSREPLSRLRALLWRDALPEAVGIALVALMLAGVVGMALYAERVARAQLRQHELKEGRRAAAALAAALAPHAETDSAQVGALMADFAGATNIRACRWIDATGAVRGRFGPADAAFAAARADAGRSPHLAFESPVRSGDAALGTVQIERAASPVTGGRDALLRGAAAAAIVILLGYVGVYQTLRRRLRPLAAIERSLKDYTDGIERELRTLMLSDGLGPVAAAWNRLIGQLVDFQCSGARDDGGTLALSAMQRFEGRALRGMLDQLPLGVLRINAAEHVVYANAAAERLLDAAHAPDGSEATPLAGRPLTEIIGEQPAAALLRGAGGRARETFLTRESGDGEATMTLRVAVGGRAAAGEALVTVEDVSHLREVERARDTFLYHVTHELRTPLTNIHAYAETLSRPDFDDEQTRRECYNVIVSETRRLSTLVENILNVSQLEVGTARIEMDDVDLVRLLRAMVQDNLGAADAKRIDLALKLPPKAPRVRGDKQRLAVVINNLIGNAVKYTPEGGRVDVSLDAEGGMARITVRDTGIGIPPEEQPRVFEKFYRATNAQTGGAPGTGLGLAIAREIARLHGGDVWLTSEVGKGTTFVAEVPIHDAQQ